MKRLFVVTSLLSIAALTGAAIAGTAANGKKAVPKEVSGVGSRFAAAVNAKDAAKAAALYSDGGSLMVPNGETIQGRANIEAFWRALVAQNLTITTTTTAMDASGSIGYEVGTYELSIGTGEKATHDRGKYLNLMRREADGHWRMIVDIWNSSLPASPPQVSDFDDLGIAAEALGFNSVIFTHWLRDFRNRLVATTVTEQ